MAIIAVVALMGGCAQREECAEYFQKARSGAVENFLRSWVDEKNGRGLLDRKAAVEGPFFIPGEYNVRVDEPLAGILGPSYGARVVVGTDGRPESVAFGAGNFQGLLVLVSGAKNTIVPDGVLRPVTERVSVMCSKRD